MRKIVSIFVVLMGLTLAPDSSWGQAQGGRFELTFSTGGLLEDVIIDHAPFPQAFLSGLALGDGLPARYPVEATAKFDLDTGYLYLFSGLYKFTKHIAGELTVGGSTSNFGGEVTGVVIIDPSLPGVPVHGVYSFDNSQFLLRGDLVLQLPLGNFAPFVTFGAGIVYFAGELRKADIVTQNEEGEIEEIEIEKAGFVALGVHEGLLEFAETSYQLGIGAGLKYYIPGGFLFRFGVRDTIVLNPATDFFRTFQDTRTLHLLEITGSVGITF